MSAQKRRLSRWLKNPKIVCCQMYSGLIQTALADWEQSEMYLSLNSSLLWNEYCLIRLVVIYRGRGLTMAWRVIKHASSSVAYEDYQSLLSQATSQLKRAFWMTSPMALSWNARIFAMPRCSKDSALF